MASTQKRQELARARKQAATHAQSLLSRLKANTTTWVDDSYGMALGKLLIKTIDEESKTKTNYIHHLERVRKLTGYISEEPCVKGTKVWFLDSSVSSPGCGYLTSLFYDKDGRWDASVASPDNITITAHALGRCYQRLRTNSSSDLKALLNKLVGLVDAQDHLGKEVEVTVPGGRFYLIQDNVSVSLHEDIKRLRDTIEKKAVECGFPLDDPDVQQSIKELIEEQRVPVTLCDDDGNSFTDTVPLKTIIELKVGNPGWVVKTFIADKM